MCGFVHQRDVLREELEAAQPFIERADAQRLKIQRTIATVLKLWPDDVFMPSALLACVLLAPVAESRQYVCLTTARRLPAWHPRAGTGAAPRQLLLRAT